MNVYSERKVSDGPFFFLLIVRSKDCRSLCVRCGTVSITEYTSVHSGLKQLAIPSVLTNTARCCVTISCIVNIGAPPISAQRYCRPPFRSTSFTSSHFQLNRIHIAFDLFSASLPCMCKKKKKYKRWHCISASSVILGRKRAVFRRICSVKCKWRTSDTVSSFSPPCLSVAGRRSWLARQAGLSGHCVCVYGGMRRVNNLPR